MIVRDAMAVDMPQVLDLYNSLIPTTTVAWTEQLQTLDERLAWFEHQQRRQHPVLVADNAGRILGFTAYGDFRGAGKWPGYRHTVEHTIHVARDQWGRGTGRLLIETLAQRAEESGVHVMVAAIDSDNIESVAFHQQLGFAIVAKMPEVGQKFGRWLDLVLMQRILPTL